MMRLASSLMIVMGRVITGRSMSSLVMDLTSVISPRGPLVGTSTFSLLYEKEFPQFIIKLFFNQKKNNYLYGTNLHNINLINN